MKIRNGFVSNSSSSSFILFKAYLTPEQMKQIRNWKDFCLSDEYKEMLDKYEGDLYPHETENFVYDRDSDKMVSIHVEPFDEGDYAYYPEGWEVIEGPTIFDFYTDMDNFDMEQFLKVIGVDIDKCGIWDVPSGSYRSVLGLNDARTDLQNYANDKYFMDDYDNNYYYTSKLYKERIYPVLKEWYDKQPDNEFKGYPPHPPVEPKKWICEDAGGALKEAEHKIKELAEKNGCYFLETMANGEYYNEKCKLYAEILDTIREVEDNWQAVDEYEGNAMEDDSQRVIASLEGQGFYNFNGEEETAYNESINKLYKPTGINIKELRPEDC